MHKDPSMKASKKALIYTLLSLCICIAILTYTSFYILEDYHHTLGFSSIKNLSNPIINNDMIADGEFYKRTFLSILSLDYFNNISKEFISGPVVPLLIFGVPQGNAIALYALFSALLGLGVFNWTRMIFENSNNHIFAHILAAIICLNPFNYYFVVKPGSEIIFFTILSFLISNTKKISTALLYPQETISNLKTLAYSFSSLTCLMVMTRPNTLIFSLLGILALIRASSSKISKRFGRYTLYYCILLCAIFFAASVSIYIPYALRAFTNLSDTSHTVTYFGVPELTISAELDKTKSLLKIPLFIMWKFSNWILAICGIRDSFSNIQTVSGLAGQPWQVITRITWGLIVYLPLMILGLFSTIKLFIDAVKRRFNFEYASYVLPSLIAMALIIPNIMLYNNERYIYMVYPAFIVTLSSLSENYQFKIARNVNQTKNR